VTTRWHVGSGIRVKAGLLFAACVVALITIYITFGVELVRREAASSRERLEQTARMAASALDAYVEAGRQRLAVVARLPGLAYGLEAVEDEPGEGHIAPWTSLHYLFFRSDVFTCGVFLVDRTGTALWSEPPGAPWLGERVGITPGVAAVYETGEPLTSGRLAPDALCRTPHIVVSFPVRGGDDAIVGVLGGVIDLTAPEFAGILSSVSTAHQQFVRLTDGAGGVVAGPEHDPAAGDGTSPLLASATMTQAPWTVTVGQPAATALAGTIHLRRLLLAFGVALLVLMVFLGTPIVRRFVGTVEALTRHAERMATGDLALPVPIQDRPDEIGTLARTFERMRVELQRSRSALERRLEERDELIRVKEEFLANVSHELRTPLNVIIGYTDILVGELRDEGAHDLLGRVRDQSEHMARLVQDLLTLCTLNRGKLSLELGRVSPADVVRRLRSFVDGLQSGKQLAVTWDCPLSLPAIVTDRLRLEEVLGNLITNAFKFTAEGGIAIRVREADGGDCVVFEVADTGIGIPADELPHIFDEFRQVDGSMSRRQDGVGLGLALVRKLAVLLGAEVNVVSDVGRGTMFTVAVPVSGPRARPDDVAAPSAPRDV